MMDEEGGLALGFVYLAEERISWFDDREHVGEGKLAADGRTIEYPPDTPWEQAREWNTERGQLVVQLAQKARAVCDTTTIESQ